MKYCKTHLYADDMQLYFSCPVHNMDDAVRKINADLESVFHATAEHHLSLNPAKSVAVIFGNPDHIEGARERVRLGIAGAQIPVVDEVKNLGVIIDNSFRYRKHVNKCLQRSYGCLKLLYPHRSYLSAGVKLQLCNSLVLSKLNYCSQVFSPCLDSETRYKIQKLQNSCLRYAYGIRKYQHVSHKLIVAGWLNMSQRFAIQELCLYHSVLQKKMPAYLYNKIRFRTDVHNINIRRRNSISVPLHKLSMFERSFTYRIYKTYNPLPENLKSCDAKNFKKRLTAHIGSLAVGTGGGRICQWLVSYTSQK